MIPAHVRARRSLVGFVESAGASARDVDSVVGSGVSLIGSPGR
jgi:hypothetical protein